MLWHRSTKTPDPYTDPLSLGNIAIRMGYATREQVESAVRIQQKRLPIGRILVEENVLTEAQLAEILVEQETVKMRLSATQVSHRWRSYRRKFHQEVVDAFQDVAQALKAATKG